MNIESLIGKMVTGTLLGGSKSSNNTSRFLTGGGGFLNASTLLTLGGLAWGAVETMQQQAAPNPAATMPPIPSTSAPAVAVPPVPGAAPSSAPAPFVPPPLPTASAPPVASAAAIAPGAERMVRLLVSAARADGELSDVERSTIRDHARAVGVEALVSAEIDRPTPIDAIVDGITDAKQRQDLYVLAYAIVRADETVTGAERIYLAQLAARLGLDDGTVARLEADTASRIDAHA